jgi:hypothetical protein
VRPSDDLSPPRRRIFFPVVIATVFLTIIGMTAGFTLGERHRRAVRAAAEQTPGSGPGTQWSPAAAPTRTGPRCPAEAEETALRTLSRSIELYQVLKVQTENQTTVWICQDATGALYFQSKTGGLDAQLVEGKNGLFLPGVLPRGPGQYQAVADDGNQFVVDRTELVIHFAKGGTETHRVIAD